MIEYDYEIIRNEGDESKTFKPDKISKVLENCITIEGPNSIGKSTLLHILALGFHGSKNQKIHPSLKEKINNLLNSSHQNLKYELKITNSTNTLELTSEKTDSRKPEIIVREISNGNKTILSPELFERKYNLIYDIPENPTGRLNQLTNEVKEKQLIYGNNLGYLKEHLRQIITDIGNPEENNKNLNEKINKIDKLNEEETNLNKELIFFEEKLELLEDATYSKYYRHYFSLEKDTNDKIQTLKSKIKSAKQNDKKINKEYYNNLNWTKNKLDDLQKTYHKATSILKKVIPKENEHYLYSWGKIDFNTAYEEYNFNYNIIEQIISFKTIINELNDKYKDTFKEIELYQDLIGVLVQYNTLNIIVPGSQVSISEFIANLESSLKEKEKQITNKKNIDESLELLEKIKQQVEELEKTFFPKIKELKEKIESNVDFNLEDEAINEKISKLEVELKKYQEKLDFYIPELNKRQKSGICEIGDGILKDYSNYTEKQLLSEISSIKEKILSKKITSKENKRIIKNISDDVLRLQDKKPHKYENYHNELTKLLKIVEILETKFKKEFPKYINDINDIKIDPNRFDKKQSNYYDVLFNYLGKRLDTFHHIDKEYKVKKIDLIKKVIITEDGKNINLLDMGTGQGQCAYLKSLLNSSDNRPIIALFDEVAMMDSKTLGSIHEELKKLYNENRLLVGITVQRADIVKISKI